LASLEAAAQAVVMGECTALVTAPLNKTAIALAGCPHPGHTEWLAEFCQCEVAMMFAADLSDKTLNVLLASIHVPLAKAIQVIDQALILKRLQQAQAGAHLLGYHTPRIAVAGLNPHASEQGLFGHEEAEHIVPAIASAQAQGIQVSGPYPPDTVFMRALAGEFDLVLAMSHDQGLIPVKLLGWERAVNITVGLPFLRVSVDHGTAYDIAGKGVADERNLLHVLRFAERCLMRT
jgi:4-hydroxythreonine-4-phosphate dehydrogenase